VNSEEKEIKQAEEAKYQYERPEDINQFPTKGAKLEGAS
jgi:hypothetical protein